MKKIAPSLFFFVLLLFSQLVLAQFENHPKRVNLTIELVENQWKLSNSSKTQVYYQGKSPNIYVQIIANKIRVFEVSTTTWDAQISPDSLLKITPPTVTTTVEVSPSRFDNYASFWLSSEGGHIRMNKRKETLTVEGKTYTNKYCENALFLNQYSKSKIANSHSKFIICETGNVFEVDQKQKIWRFIYTNNTFSAWQNTLPSEKMMFNIYSPKDYAHILPVGIKEGAYLYQIIDHENKMGLVSLSTNFEDLVMLVAPEYDFISPSLHTPYHLIYHNQKLGVMVPKNDVSPVFSSAQKSLTHHKKNTLLADSTPFTPGLNTLNQNLPLQTAMNFGIEKITNDLLLYSEYSFEANTYHSGLFRISQNAWYLQPAHALLKPYPNAIIQYEVINQVPTYSSYTINGDLRQEEVTNMYSQAFFEVVSMAIDLPIDTLVKAPNFSGNMYQFKSGNTWGLLSINKENIYVILRPEFAQIFPLANPNSLVTISANDPQKMGWFGQPVCGEGKFISKEYSYTYQFTQPENECAQNTVQQESVHFFGPYVVYNFLPNNTQTERHAWLKKEVHSAPLLSANYMVSNTELIAVVDAKDASKNTLYTTKLKEMNSVPFSDALVRDETLLLTQNVANSSSNQPSVTVVGAFLGKKQLSFKKYKVYWVKNTLVAKSELGWVILQLNGTPKNQITYASYSLLLADLDSK